MSTWLLHRSGRASGAQRGDAGPATGTAAARAAAAAALTCPLALAFPFPSSLPRYMRFCQVLQSGSVEEAERLHGELLALLYSIQFSMQAREGGGGGGSGISLCRAPTSLCTDAPVLAAVVAARQAAALMHDTECGDNTPPLLQKLHAMSGAFEREQQLYAEKQAQLQASIQQVGAATAVWIGGQPEQRGRRSQPGKGSQFGRWLVAALLLGIAPSADLYPLHCRHCLV